MIRFFLSALLVALGAINCHSEQPAFDKGITDNSYLQDTMTRVLLPGNQTPNVVSLLNTPRGIAAVGASNESYLYHNGQWSNILSPAIALSAVLHSNQLFIGSVGSLFNVFSKKEITLPGTAAKDSLQTLFSNGSELYIGTNCGMWVFANNRFTPVPEFNGLSVRQISLGAENELWAATNDGLWEQLSGKWMNLNDHIVASSLDRNYYAIAPRKDPREMLYGHQYSFGQISKEGNHWVETGATGLPYGPVTSIAEAGQSIWVGTSRGVAKKTDKWHYYAGQRWLNNDTVNAILAIDDKTVWMATPAGINEIKQIPMTLEKKAQIFEQRHAQRHRFHDFSSICYFDDPHNPTRVSHRPNDNDGLWSAVYLAAESFRYAVTGDPSAKENAERTFLAMERLETMTPIDGFPARSYTRIDLPNDNHGEWHPTADSTWQWKGDTSSDEIVGHLFAYPLFYDLVAQGELKDRVKQLTDRITSHIVDHNFHLVDLDGKPTRWAVWCPDSLNHSPRWWYERNINSLQILSFLETAYHITGNEKYTRAYNELIDKHHYDQNMMQTKMYGPFEVNHSDDELAYFPYYCLMRYARNDSHRATFEKSLQRSWKVEEKDRIPIWNFIASAGLHKNCGVEVAVEELRDIPLDTREWRMENSHRWDIRRDPIPDRFGKVQSITPIPSPERSVTKWNFNTFQLDNGSSGTAEDDGAFYLLAYWMGRYHGFIR